MPPRDSKNGTSDTTSSQSRERLHHVLNDTARLAALERTELLDTAPEEAFDRLTALAARVLDAPIAAVSLVDTRRQFYKSRVAPAELADGPREAPLSHSYCKHVVGTGQPLSVGDARTNALLRDNPAAREMGIIGYVGVPLTTEDGYTLGALCAMDTQPRDWPANAVDILEALATTAMTEIRLRRLVAELTQANAALRSLQLQRDELLHTIIHDLRNPLMSVMCGLDLIGDGTLDSTQREDLKLARDGADALLHLVNEILEVRRAEAGHLTLERRVAAPAALIEAARQQLAMLARNAGVQIEAKAPGSLPSVPVDHRKLTRVLVNLIANAVQHTAEGGRVSVSAAFVDDERRRVVFSVSDTGAGIAPDEVDRIFEKFATGSGRRRSGATTGLGLSLSRMIVEAHGGSIWVESELGAGTRFSFFVPLE